MAAWLLHGVCFEEDAGAQNLVFLRVKWLQAAVKGIPCVCGGCGCDRFSSLNRFALGVLQHVDANRIVMAAWMGTCCSMQPLQCDLHSHVAEHQGRTDFARNDPNRTRRTHEVPFIATCSHFTRKNAWFRAPASSPTQAPFNIRSATMWCKVGYKVSHHPSRMLCSVM